MHTQNGRISADLKKRSGAVLGLQYVNWGLGLENAILTPICALGAGKGHV